MPRELTHIGRIGLIAAFAIVAMLPAYFSGIPAGNDQSQHFQFANTIYSSIRSGDLYPSFAAETNHGFGDYGIRFYPPLTYYALSAAYFVVGDWYIASLAVFTLVFFCGGLGIYLWAREEFGPTQSLIAALLYTFAPYHLNQLYNNALFAEFFATAIIPVCFLLLTRVCRKAGWLDALALAVVYSLLILTHLPLTILCSLAMGIYCLFMLRGSALVSALPKLSFSVSAAVAMTAFYWSRFLPELDWITHSSPKYFSTIWDYRTNFLLVPDHFLKFGEDVLNLWFADILLVATLLVTIPTAVYLLSKRVKAGRFTIAAAAVLAISVFMTTPLSSPIWNNVGFLQKVQFPWRLMTIVSAFAAIVASVGIAKAADGMKKGGSSLATIGLGVVLAAFFFTATFVTRGAAYVPRTQFNAQIANIADAESCDCWWPVWAKREAFAQTVPVSVPGRNIVSSLRTPSTRRFAVDAGESATATVAAFYYPRWQASVNGNATEIVPDANGLMTVRIPPDSAEVELTFREPEYVRYASTVSALAWLLVLAFGAVLLIKSMRAETLSVARP